MNRISYMACMAAFFLTACQPSKSPATKSSPTSKVAITKAADSVPQTLYDTAGLSKAPVKILAATIRSKNVDTVDQPADNLHHEGHFGRFITLKVKYKNVSSKRIIGAILYWFIVDKDGHPTTVDSVKSGLQMGYMGTLAPYNPDFSFGIGEIQTNEWEYPSQSGEKVKLAFPSEIEFYDHSKWKIGKK